MMCRCAACDMAISHTKDEHYTLVKFKPKVNYEFCSYRCLLHYVIRMK